MQPKYRLFFKKYLLMSVMIQKDLVIIELDGMLLEATARAMKDYL